MSQHEAPKLPSLFTPIDIADYPKERFQRLWDNLSTQDYAFDDASRGDWQIFIAQFLLPNNLFFEIGDLQGLVMAASIVQQVNANLHFSVWGDVKVTELNRAAKQLAAWLFDTYGLRRLTAFIPQSNDKAKRMAVLLGMKYEGNLREGFLTHGKYEDILFYGLLQSEFETLRKF